MHNQIYQEAHEAKRTNFRKTNREIKNQQQLLLYHIDRRIEIKRKKHSRIH